MKVVIGSWFDCSCCGSRVGSLVFGYVCFYSFGLQKYIYRWHRYLSTCIHGRYVYGLIVCV